MFHRIAGNQSTVKELDFKTLRELDSYYTSGDAFAWKNHTKIKNYHDMYRWGIEAGEVLAWDTGRENAGGIDNDSLTTINKYIGSWDDDIAFFFYELAQKVKNGKVGAEYLVPEIAEAQAEDEKKRDEENASKWDIIKSLSDNALTGLKTIAVITVVGATVYGVNKLT